LEGFQCVYILHILTCIWWGVPLEGFQCVYMCCHTINSDYRMQGKIL